MTLREVRGIALKDRACLVQVVGCGSQGLQRRCDGGHRADVGDRGVGLRPGPGFEIAERVVQRLCVLLQQRCFVPHDCADPRAGDMVAVDEVGAHVRWSRPGPEGPDAGVAITEVVCGAVVCGAVVCGAVVCTAVAITEVGCTAAACTEVARTEVVGS